MIIIRSYTWSPFNETFHKRLFYFIILAVSRFQTSEKFFYEYFTPTKVKVKFSRRAYTLPSVGPGVQAISPQVTLSHPPVPPGGRLPSPSARPAVTFPTEEPIGRYQIKLLGDRGTRV